MTLKPTTLPILKNQFEMEVNNSERELNKYGKTSWKGTN
jgi:hypothetical protein